MVRAKSFGAGARGTLFGIVVRRWSTTAVAWVPQAGHRARGRPKQKWTTDIDAYLKHKLGVPSGAWMVVAGDRETWQRLENGFVNSAWYS